MSSGRWIFTVECRRSFAFDYNHELLECGATGAQSKSKVSNFPF